MEGSPNVCKCPHHKMMPIAIILIALVFLAKALGYVDEMTASIAWPILLIIGIAPKLGGCKCCARA